MAILSDAIAAYRDGRGTFDDIDIAMANLHDAFDSSTGPPDPPDAPPAPAPELPLSTTISGALPTDSEADPD